MTYAILRINGKQYKVEKGQTLIVDQLSSGKDEKIKGEDVLLLNNGDKILIGKPKIQGASVLLKVLNHQKGEKIFVEKFKSKSRYHRRTGHRQKQTEVMVEDIVFPKSSK